MLRKYFSQKLKLKIKQEKADATENPYSPGDHNMIRPPQVACRASSIIKVINGDQTSN